MKSKSLAKEVQPLSSTHHECWLVSIIWDLFPKRGTGDTSFTWEIVCLKIKKKILLGGALLCDIAVMNFFLYCLRKRRVCSLQLKQKWANFSTISLPRGKCRVWRPCQWGHRKKSPRVWALRALSWCASVTKQPDLSVPPVHLNHKSGVIRSCRRWRYLWVRMRESKKIEQYIKQFAFPDNKTLQM